MAICIPSYPNGREGYTIYKRGQASESLCLFHPLGMPGTWYYPYSDLPAGPFENLRSQAFHDFDSSSLILTCGGSNSWNIGASLEGYGGWYAGTSYGPVSPPEYASRGAVISMEMSKFATFFSSKPYGASSIRRAKFIGYLDKKIEGGGTDFNIFVSRVSSNIWPVTLNSSGDMPLFAINTANYNNGALFETTIDPNNINPDGINVWQSTSDIPIPASEADNPIPGSIPNDLSDTFAGGSSASFVRSVHIRNSALIVIYEMKENP